MLLSGGARDGGALMPTLARTFFNLWALTISAVFCDAFGVSGLATYRQSSRFALFNIAKPVCVLAFAAYTPTCLAGIGCSGIKQTVTVDAMSFPRVNGRWPNPAQDVFLVRDHFHVRNIYASAIATKMVDN